MTQELFLNGIDADKGNYLFQGITTSTVTQVARGVKLDINELKDVKIRKSRDLLTKNHIGIGFGMDSNDVSQAGWSVIFPASLSTKSLEAIKEALKPLLDHRMAEACQFNETFYKEASGPEGYRAGETKNDFLGRFGRGSGAANPSKFPYYVLIIGDPETIPFSFQHQLDIQYAVGRIYFTELENYYQYAINVVQSETKSLPRAKNVTFFSVENSDDPATLLSSKHLIQPLVDSIRASNTDWDVDLVSSDKATKATLARYLGGEYTPTLFFSASHGVGFKPGHWCQNNHQGALICQDWPGPLANVPITDQLYFSGDDISSDANLSGMIIFFFACYGAGTPKFDNFYRQTYNIPKQIAPNAFIAQLPLKLLGHPKGGALAVYAHVDRAWATSFISSQTIRDVETYKNTIKALLDGKRAGYATEYFGARYAELSSDLMVEIESSQAGQGDDKKIAGLWTSNNDARNFTLLGDPAIYINVG